jgi:acetyltransferase-like isoleucine patch superfamily enzyme
VGDAPFIHPSALVEDGAVLGERTRVWHHAHIRSAATIGPDATIGRNVYVDAGVRVGARTKIQNNVSVYRGVELADEVFVGPSAVFTNDRSPRAVSPDWVVTPTLVGRGASIGANATVVCGIELAAWSMVAAGAVVTRSTREYQLVAGNPARHHGWVCRCGAIVSREVAAPDPSTLARCSHRGGG